jgi:flagellar hook-basal body complex protein FliE
MSIPALSAISSAIAPISGPTSAASAGQGVAGGDFSSWLGKALDHVSDAQSKADGLAVQAATGDLNAVHDFTIASTEAQLLTQLTVEVRNKAVEAFNDIMRMQV